MQKTCTQCQAAFESTQDDLVFYEKVSPVFGGKKYQIPPPTHCPDCRQQRRIAHINERYLYQGTCGLCHQATLTEHPPHFRQPIYCRECWHSDRWNPLSYGREVDFSRSFFTQLAELKRSVPAIALNVQGTLINSDYIHHAGSCKNCYLIMHADYCEDCYYGYGFKQNKNCVDGFYNLHCELCYDCVDCHQCYDLTCCQECLNCHSSAFLRDCVGCKHCFLCVGLREREYCFENQQLSREEYKVRMSAVDLGSQRQYEEWKAKRRARELCHTFKEFQGHNLQNCSGNHLYNCKDVRESFDCEDVECAKHCYQIVLGAKDLYDVNQYGTNLQQSYECCICGENNYHLLFCESCHISCSDLLYCWYMESSRHCFGCANMHRQTHCILNKQYSKEEYEVLIPRIIEHMRETSEWGEYLPIQTSLFGYNKSTAQLYYPLTKEQAETKGWKWDEYEPPLHTMKKTIPASKLPDSINDIPDDILNWTLICEKTGRPFKIQQLELKFLRRMHVPIPRRHPDQRHLDRFAQRNPRKLWPRTCGKCGKGIQTTYSPERPEIVYCEECYLKEVYYPCPAFKRRSADAGTLFVPDSQGQMPCDVGIVFTDSPSPPVLPLVSQGPRDSS